MGILSKTLKKDIRLERINLNGIKFIDLGLPFLIADKDLIIDDSEIFDYKQMNEHRKFIENKGYRIPSIKDLEHVINESFLKYDFIKEDYIVTITSSKTNEQIEFESDYKFAGFEKNYWLCNSEIDLGNSILYYQWEIIKDKNPKYKEIPRSRFHYGEKQNKCHIRLIQDK